MEWEKQNQHQEELQQLPQLQIEELNNGENNEDMFVKVMTEEQMEVLQKQIAAYATICEQLEDLYRCITTHNDPSSFLLRNPYCSPLLTSSLGHKLPRRQRWNPTGHQLQILERVFVQGNETPSKEKVRDITAELAKHGQIAETNVYNWFQNRRARMKKKQFVSAEAKVTGESVEHMVIESPNGENSKRLSDLELIRQKNSEKVSSGKSIICYDQQSIEKQQAMFPMKGHLKPNDGGGSSFGQMAFHGKVKVDHLVGDMAVNTDCHNTYI